MLDRLVENWPILAGVLAMLGMARAPTAQIVVAPAAICYNPGVGEA